MFCLQTRNLTDPKIFLGCSVEFMLSSHNADVYITSSLPKASSSAVERNCFHKTCFSPSKCIHLQEADETCLVSASLSVPCL